ncbi:MAG: DUF6044 family protein [Alphaproteobacteria bacterium]
MSDAAFERRALALGGILLALFFAVTFLPPSSAPAVSHDYLDSIYLYYVLLARHPEAFLDLQFQLAALPGAYPLNALALNDFGVAELIYRLAPPFAAYAANTALTMALAFAGVYLLLRDHVLPPGRAALLTAIALALFFALLPHKASRLGVLAALPLLAWAVAYLWQGRGRAWCWAVVVFYPLYAPFHYGGYTVCGLLLVAAVAAWARGARGRFGVTLAFALVTGLYGLSLYRQFYHWLGPAYAYESVRQFMPHNVTRGIVDWGGFLRDWLVQGAIRPGWHHFHIEAPTAVIQIWATAMAAAAVLLVRWRRGAPSARQMARRDLLILLGLAGAVFVLALINQADYRYAPMNALFGLPLALHRLDLPASVLLVVLMALSSLALARGPRAWVRALAGANLALLVLHALVYNIGFRTEIKAALGAPPTASVGQIVRHALAGTALPAATILPETLNGRHRERAIQPLADYFEIDAFARIRADLDRRLGAPAGYRVMSLGLAPSVAQFHGLYTIDGRFYDAPVTAARALARIFVAEATKDGRGPALSQVMTDISETSRRAGGAIAPDLDLCAFARLGGRAILSLWPLANARDLGLDLLGVYAGTIDPLRVYVLADPGAVCGS